MIRLEYAHKDVEGNAEVWCYTLVGLPPKFSKGYVELVDNSFGKSLKDSEMKVYYARVHLWTTERDLITLTTTSQGEWLTEDECMRRVQRFLNQIEKCEEVK